MRYVVVGVGRQGLAAVYDLVRNCEASAVLAIDARFLDEAAQRQAQKQLEGLLGDLAGRVCLKATDLEDASGMDRLVSLIRGHDCILSALPYSLNGGVSKAAIAARVPMCDMGGNPAMVDQQKELAEQHDHILVPECGLAPGIANIFAKHLYERHGATDIRMYCGGLPAQKPDPAVNPLQYKLVFSPEGLVSEYMGPCPILREGRVGYAPALTGQERFDADHEAFFTSNNSPRILHYLASLGIRTCEYRTLRYHGHLEKIRVLQSLGFLQGVGNTDDELAARLAASAVLKFDRAKDRDKVLLCVRGRSDDGAAGTIELVDEMDDGTRLTAMERTTSWGTTIVAHALARGLVRPRNFATPEQFIDTKWFIEQLQRRTKKLTIT